MTPAPNLQELIDAVHEDAGSRDALDQLAQAARIASQLEETNDALLSHGSPAVALIHDRVLRDLEAAAK